MDKELEQRIERVYDILRKRLPKAFRDTFGEELDPKVVDKAVQDKIIDLKGFLVKESVRHLTDEDLILARDYVLTNKYPFPAPKPAPVKKPRVVRKKKK